MQNNLLIEADTGATVFLSSCHRGVPAQLEEYKCPPAATWCHSVSVMLLTHVASLPSQPDASSVKSACAPFCSRIDWPALSSLQRWKEREPVMSSYSLLGLWKITWSGISSLSFQTALWWRHWVVSHRAAFSSLQISIIVSCLSFCFQNMIYWLQSNVCL